MQLPARSLAFVLTIPIVRIRKRSVHCAVSDLHVLDRTRNPQRCHLCILNQVGGGAALRDCSFSGGLVGSRPALALRRPPAKAHGRRCSAKARNGGGEGGGERPAGLTRLLPPLDELHTCMHSTSGAGEARRRERPPAGCGDPSTGGRPWELLELLTDSSLYSLEPFLHLS